MHNIVETPSEIQNDHKAIAEEERDYKPIPAIENVSYEDLIENYIKIKQDIEQLFVVELEKILARQPRVEEPGKSLPDDDQNDEEEVERGFQDK